MPDGLTLEQIGTLNNLVDVLNDPSTRLARSREHTADALRAAMKLLPAPALAAGFYWTYRPQVFRDRPQVRHWNGEYWQIVGGGVECTRIEIIGDRLPEPPLPTEG